MSDELRKLIEPFTREMEDSVLGQIAQDVSRRAALADEARNRRLPERRYGMSRVLRCKMRVSEVLDVKNADGSTSQERVKLQAVYGSEGTDNAQWSKWTPSANFEISISNPDAFGQLSNGHEFYVDFIPATE